MTLESVLAILNNDLFQKIVILIIGTLGIGKFLKNRAVQKYAEIAFRSVEEFSRIDAENGNKNKTDYKINMFAQQFRSFMQKAGWWIVTDSDIEQAKNIAKAVNLIYSTGQAVIKSATEIAKPDVAAPTDAKIPN